MKLNIFRGKAMKILAIGVICGAIVLAFGRVLVERRGSKRQRKDQPHIRHMFLNGLRSLDLASQRIVILDNGVRVAESYLPGVKRRTRKTARHTMKLEHGINLRRLLPL